MEIASDTDLKRAIRFYLKERLLHYKIPVQFEFVDDEFVTSRKKRVEKVLTDSRWIDFPRITDTRGNLTFIEESVGLPFEIRRVYYLYDVPGGESRGSHGHGHLEQIILALSGSFDVVLDDGSQKQKFNLNRPFRAYMYHQ